MIERVDCNKVVSSEVVGTESPIALIKDGWIDSKVSTKASGECGTDSTSPEGGVIPNPVVP